MAKITDFIEFDPKGRAACPVCLTQGKNKKNLALIPNTDGAYKCHAGYTTDQIRSAIGWKKDEVVPFTPKKSAIKYHSKEIIKKNNKTLIDKSILAKKWLINREILLELIIKFEIGITHRDIKKYEGKTLIDTKNLPCITIPYEYSQGYLQKYFIAP